MVNWRWLVGKRRWIGGKTAWVGGKTAVEWRPNRRRLARKTALVGGKKWVGWRCTRTLAVKGSRGTTTFSPGVCTRSSVSSAAGRAKPVRSQTPRSEEGER